MSNWSELTEIKKKPKTDTSLEEALEEEDRELIHEAQQLKIKKIIKQREKELKELEEGEKEENVKGEAKSEITPDLAIELAKLPEEQRQLVLQTYATLKGAEKGEGVLTCMLPMLIGCSRANPQAQQNDIVKFAEVMTTQIKTGIDLAKSTQPAPTTISVFF